MDYELQKKNVLFFKDCRTCLDLFSPLSLYWGVTKRLSDNKENQPTRFNNFYDLYLHRVYMLDRHMNKVHNKCRLARIDYGHLHNVSEIVLLDEICDIAHKVPLHININCIYLY